MMAGRPAGEFLLIYYHDHTHLNLSRDHDLRFREASVNFFANISHYRL